MLLLLMMSRMMILIEERMERKKKKMMMGCSSGSVILYDAAVVLLVCLMLGVKVATDVCCGVDAVEAGRMKWNRSSCKIGWNEGNEGTDKRANGNKSIVRLAIVRENLCRT